MEIKSKTVYDYEIREVSHSLSTFCSKRKDNGLFRKRGGMFYHQVCLSHEALPVL